MYRFDFSPSMSSECTGASAVGSTAVQKEWQLDKSLAERNRYMLENGVETDVKFIVSNDKSKLYSKLVILYCRIVECDAGRV